MNTQDVLQFSKICDRECDEQEKVEEIVALCDLSDISLSNHQIHLSVINVP